MRREGLLEELLPARLEEPFLKTYYVCGAQRVGDEICLPSAACEPQRVVVCFSVVADAFVDWVQYVVCGNLQGCWLRRAARNGACEYGPPQHFEFERSETPNYQCIIKIDIYYIDASDAN